MSNPIIPTDTLYLFERNNMCFITTNYKVIPTTNGDDFVTVELKDMLLVRGNLSPEELLHIFALYSRIGTVYHHQQLLYRPSLTVYKLVLIDKTLHRTQLELLT